MTYNVLQVFRISCLPALCYISILQCFVILFKSVKVKLLNVVKCMFRTIYYSHSLLFLQCHIQIPYIYINLFDNVIQNIYFVMSLNVIVTQSAHCIWILR